MKRKRVFCLLIFLFALAVVGTVLLYWRWSDVATIVL